MSARLPMLLPTILLTASLLIASGGAAAQTEEAAPELEPITVTPLINPLDRNLERLRQTLDPDCEKCGPLINADRSGVYQNTYQGIGAVLSFISGMPENPPEITPEERAEGRVAGDWRQYEREPVR